MAEVEQVVQRILQYQNRYASIGAQSTVPWYVIAVIHNMECGLDFTKHLHNGDSLKRRTVNVPAGRPKIGQPPFTFEVSALDALEYDKLTEWDDWSIGGICYKLEGFNGWGYRARDINSPYLELLESLHERQICCRQQMVGHSCFKPMWSRRHPSTHERPGRYRSCFTAFIHPYGCRNAGRGSSALIRWLVKRKEWVCVFQ